MPDTNEQMPLTERQDLVLRAIVAAYVAEAAPVGSRSVSHVVPVHLSSASIRNTMAELGELGLLEKPHRSAGRVPTARGLRVFVDRVEPRGLGDFERRNLEGSVGGAEPDSLMRTTSRLLSEGTRQLGFVVAPRLEQVALRHVALVRLSRSRVLVVLVCETGEALRRVIDDEESGDQAELDRIAGALWARIAGRTLGEVREALAREVRALRSRAHGALERAVWLGWRALDGQGDDAGSDLVIATRLALLDQPEFRDPSRVRELFGALEDGESLLRVVEKVIGAGGLTVALGDELGEPELRRLAFVAAPFGSADGPPGVLGVVGSWRMDYARVMGLVEYLSRLVSAKLSA
ncbi:MAG TPA: heat-inducible transcriptional repressor HrcA [Myxococcota bacterium]|nr:heat-inducible transcriptional repressor HrcA [Myxococcota bacterium]